MNSIIISIITPVYKVEKYIERCLDSIQNQIFTNWECILVDDGSPDNSGLICDKYVQKDDRFKVIHVNNGGVSKARNIGMKQAIGKWVTFVDSDDFMDIRFLEDLYAPCKSDEDIDFVHAGCVNYFEGGRIIPNQKFEYYVGNDKTKIFEEFRGLVVSKLFNLEKIKLHNVWFDERMELAEDMVFTMDYLTYSNKYALIECTGYYYVQRVGSAVHAPRQIIYQQAYNSFMHRYQSVNRYIEVNQISHSACPFRHRQTISVLFQTILALYSMNYSRKERLYHLRNDFTHFHFALSKYLSFSIKRFLLWLFNKKLFRIGDLIFLLASKMNVIIKMLR